MKRKTAFSIGAFAVAAMVAIAMPAYAHAASLAAGHMVDNVDLLSFMHSYGFDAAGAVGAGAMAIGQVADAGGGANNHASATKFFRVAVEGATTDGRTILREWLVQMAANYNAETYAARVNCEHIRGVAPMGQGTYSSPFGAYGDVIALQASEIEDGPLKGKMALYAQINPTQGLIDLSKARQKVYSSCEIDPSFADTKQAYLVGLAVTDSPASLGTEVLAFAAGQGDKNPFAGRKLSPQNLFTASEEASIEIEAVQTPAPAAGNSVSLFKRVAEIIGLVKDKGSADDTRFADMTQAVEALAQHGQSQTGRIDQLTSQIETLTADLKAQKEAFASLTQTLSQQSAGGQRPTATGSQGGVVKTDC